ncbi:hypothetical protein [Streptosporangium saharense]|uniref:Uncharacterized protein n=1 Tax=Streptosporangium saharense TaxID=1706840 RepID=A0A7W7QH44_9ACTN|nr:hypothetical protein [Streptosporangium saharense]MBB4913490.1 hypothetical protein [Streptosporangium saharense]
MARTKKKSPRSTRATKPWWEKWGLPATIATSLVGLVFAFVQGYGEKLLGLDGGTPETTPAPSAPVSPTPSGEPLRVTKVTPVQRFDDHTWVMKTALDRPQLAQVNKEIEAAGGLESEGGEAIMRKLGAVEAEMATVEIELEGNHPKGVRIIGIQAQKKCSAPWSGTLLYGAPQGSVDPVKLGFDLEKPTPYAQYIEMDGRDLPSFRGDYFADHKYTLAQDEQVTFRMAARTRTQSCEYRYQFKLIINGKTYIQAVPKESDSPLLVSALYTDGLDGENLCSPYKRVYAWNSYSKGIIKGMINGQNPTWIEKSEAWPFCK